METQHVSARSADATAWREELDRLDLDRDPGLLPFPPSLQETIHRPKRIKRGRRKLSSLEACELTQTLANRFLSPMACSNRSLTNADLRVLAILARAAILNGGTSTDISVPEIANRAAVSHRQVQLSVSRLENYPYFVSRRYRPIKPGINKTNVYELQEDCLVKKPRIFSCRGGEEKCGVKKLKPIFKFSTSTGRTSKNKNGCRKSGLADVEGRRRRKTETKHPRHAQQLPPVALTPDQAMLAKRALAMVVKDKRPPDRPADIVQEIERLRKSEIDAFDEDAWPIVVRRHGANAYLAVIETLLMVRVRAGTDRGICSHGAYLGGIVWKSPGAINPGHTIQEILQKYPEWLQ